MTPRNLFLIILKFFGIYFTKEFAIRAIELWAAVYFLRSGEKALALWTVIYSLITLSVYILIIYFLLFRTEWIIKKLKLTDGFDQSIIPLNIRSSNVLQIAILFIGGLMLVDEIPNLFRRIYDFYQARRVNYSEYSTDIPLIVGSIVKIILAILILVKQRILVSLILKNTNPAVEVETEEE
jgi:hypothetical protein